MKKHSLESKLLFYVVFVIAFFNILMFLSAKEWNAIIVFLLVLFISYALQVSITLSFVFALISANVFKATNLLKEGLATKKKVNKKPLKRPTLVIPSPTIAKTTGDKANSSSKQISAAASVKQGFQSTTLEGLENAAGDVIKSQETLSEMTAKLGPLMDHAHKIMKLLPGLLGKKSEEI